MNSYIRFKPYQYTALAEGDIRLVSLQPDEFYKPIRISISHWPLQPVRPPLAVEEETDKLLALLAPNERLFENDKGGYLVTNPADPQSARLTTLPLEQIVPGHWPRYEALSHAHGETYETEVIFIGPVHGLETMDVCGTLAKALRRLRYTNESRNLWIDSICIDLAETGERIKHTQLTSEIYQQAYRIIAWLGEPATPQANADFAWLFSEMQDIGEKLMMTKDGKLYAKNSCDAKTLFRSSFSPFGIREVGWTPLAELLSARWFGRLWCWIEIGFAVNAEATLRCGEYQILWTHFARVIALIKGKEMPATLRGVCWNMFQSHSEFVSPKRLLEVSRCKTCADPRDHIYALLSKTPPGFQALFPVNYQIPIESLYQRVFLAITGKYRQLFLLEHCDLTHRHIGGPTWVPDWSRGPSAYDPEASLQLSSGVSEAYYSYNNANPGVLEADGIELSMVMFVSPTVPNTTLGMFQAVRRWSAHFPMDNAYITGGTMKLALALTLAGNKTKERNPHFQCPKESEWVKILDDILAVPDEQLPKMTFAVYFSAENASIMHNICGKRLFATQSGHFGIGPAVTMVGRSSQTPINLTFRSLVEGDTISLIHGTFSPMILRQTDPSSEYYWRLGLSYLVVGPSYVHGISDATTFLGYLPEHWTVRVKPDDFLGKPVRAYVNHAPQPKEPVIIPETTAKLTENTGSQILASHRCDGAFEDKKPATKGSRHTKWSYGDPRLGELPEGWMVSTSITKSRTGPVRKARRFCRTATGELVDWHPALSLNALRKRGFNFVTFKLV